jgi:succinoglycan biosynthesis transport protein ExoP
MNLKELINLYRRWVWLLIGCVILGLAAGFSASKIQAPVYEASTKVLIARGRQQSNNDMLAMNDQQLAMTYLQLIKTQPLLEEAKARLEVEIDPQDVQVSLIEGTQILQIKVQNKNAKQAADIANTLVQILIDRNETLQEGRFAVYEEGLNLQITQIKEQIDELQGEINEIDQASIHAQFEQVQTQIMQLEDQINQLEQEITAFPALLSANDRASIAAKQSQLDQLHSLLSLYQQIEANLTFIGKPVQGNTPENPQITRLQSTMNLYQQLYLNLLDNRETIRLARAQNTPVVQQIERAVIAKKPVRPIPLLYTVLSGLVGLLIAAGIILLIDYFDDSVKTMQDIQEISHAPVIGQVMELNGKGPNWKSSPAESVNFQVLDSFGSIRVYLSRLIKDKPKTVLITSAELGDGSTTVAANLALAFAQAGKSVALVDADLLHPQVHLSLGLENKNGLAEILSEKVDWQEAICSWGNLTIVSAGYVSVSSIELLESTKLVQVLEELQKKAEIVIVDGPPLSDVGAQILASRIGEILLVVQPGKTKMSMMQVITSQLGFMNVDILGVVFNRLSSSKLSNQVHN